MRAAPGELLALPRKRAVVQCGGPRNAGKLVKCLRNKEASWEERWTWPDQQMVMLTLQKGQESPAIVIVYHRDPSTSQLDEAL